MGNNYFTLWRIIGLVIILQFLNATVITFEAPSQITVFNVEAIIQLVQSGKNNKEIAADLFISENTVKYHLKTIYTILEIKHRNELSNFTHKKD